MTQREELIKEINSAKAMVMGSVPRKPVNRPEMAHQDIAAQTKAHAAKLSAHLTQLFLAYTLGLKEQGKSSETRPNASDAQVLEDVKDNNLDLDLTLPLPADTLCELDGLSSKMTPHVSSLAKLVLHASFHGTSFHDAIKKWAWSSLNGCFDLLNPILLSIAPKKEKISLKQLYIKLSICWENLKRAESCPASPTQAALAQIDTFLDHMQDAYDELESSHKNVIPTAPESYFDDEDDDLCFDTWEKEDLRAAEDVIALMKPVLLTLQQIRSLIHDAVQKECSPQDAFLYDMAVDHINEVPLLFDKLVIASYPPHDQDDLPRFKNALQTKHGKISALLALFGKTN